MRFRQNPLYSCQCIQSLGTADTRRPRCSAEHQTTDFSPLSASRSQCLHLFMTSVSDISIPMGKYVVSPSTQQTDSGDFRASITISSGRGASSHHRIYRFNPSFKTREDAHFYAMTQGWAHTSACATPMC